MDLLRHPCSRLSSTAVMSRRHEPKLSLDYFPTPPWATRALFEQVIVDTPHWSPGLLVRGQDQSVLDPACGEGHMALVATEYFNTVFASDIFDYGFGSVADFVHPDFAHGADWVISNPPFNLAVEFILQAARTAWRGFAMLVRTNFLECADRFNRLFADFPPTLIAQFVERVPMHRGRWVVNGKSATAYSWLVWKVNAPRKRPDFMWISNARKTCSRHNDWIDFGGVVDVPKKHSTFQLIKKLEETKFPSEVDAAYLRTINQVSALRGGLTI